MKSFLRCLLITAVALGVSLPSHAGMVGTAQMQANPITVDLGSMVEKRAWINEQLVVGGVASDDAKLRVAAMTDSQVLQLHQRIDQQPAGGNALFAVVLIILFTELMGYTDIIPAIRPAN